jgi:F0F1-type ATP synthase delta subunit
MNRIQINNIIKAISKYDNLSEKALKWICYHLSTRELKLFKTLLCKEIQRKKVIVYFAGTLHKGDKYKIINMFLNSKVYFIRDDKKIIGGVCIEYNYYIYDYTIRTMITNIVEQITNKSK